MYICKAVTLSLNSNKNINKDPVGKKRCESRFGTTGFCVL